MSEFDPNALYSDYSPEYVIPWEPAAYSQVTLRLRTSSEGVDHCTVSVQEDRDYEMVRSAEDGRFAWYTAVFHLDDRRISWFFNIYTEDGRRIMFTRHGVENSVRDSSFWNMVPGYRTPDWMRGAVIYQIFVDRFCNGDTSNDVLTDEYRYIGGNTVRVASWDKYPAPDDIREFYGGDLQGIISRLDYLQDLGVDAIYCNPLFVSPSNHKYDSQDYGHIDPHFGKIIQDSGELLPDAQTDNIHATRYICRTTDPGNLKASDDLFAELTKAAHQRGIRVIIDGVFNHCGSFCRWMDRERIYENNPDYPKGAYISADSPYRGYFQFYADKWPYNPNYDGWWGHDTLPKLNYENSAELTDYILHIAQRWVSPPFSADGWRLDVAADLGHSPEFNHSFWKRFRSAVKQANPDAVILAENYGDSAPWLQGDEWDTIMNYEAFMEPVTWFLTGMEKHSDDFRADMLGNADAFWRAMTYYDDSGVTAPSMFISMNELSNHDHSRFLTRTNHRVGRSNSLGSAAADENVNKAVLREAAAIQMTWPGAPTIYYGDEAGVCGFTDPDNRRTYPWGHEDRDLICFHRDLIRIHKTSPCLISGALRRMKLDRDFISYARFLKGEAVVTAVNNSSRTLEEDLPVRYAGVPDDAVMEILLCSDAEGFRTGTEQQNAVVKAGVLRLVLPATSVMLLRWRKA